MTTFLLLIACGIVGGLLFFFLHIPGGAMLGAVVAVLAVKMLGHVETDTPHLFQLGAQIAIGVMVGNMMTGGTLLEIRAMAPLMFGSTALLVVAGALGPGSSAARPGWTRAAPSWPPAPAACRPWWAWPPTWAPTPLPCWPSIWCACTPSCCWRRSWAGGCTVCCRTADTGHKKTAGEGASPPGPDSDGPAATAGRISSKQCGHIPAAPLPDAIKKAPAAAGAMMPQCVLARIPSGTGQRMPFPKNYSEKRRRGSGPSR